MSTRKSKTMKFLESLTGEELHIGSLLYSIRKSEGMTQIEFAERLDISKSHLCDIEKGRKSVSPDRAIKFAKSLGYSEKQFVRLSLQAILDESGISMKVDVA